MTEYFRPSSKKGRGKSKASLTMIDAMHRICQAAQPITGRGVGYKLFTMGLIPDMSRRSMAKVYSQLVYARENGIIPWEWIVDETRELERVATWDNPEQFIEDAMRSYRRDSWRQQPVRVQVWSEKGTVRGVLRPVLDLYGVDFRVLHGFNSATGVYDAAQDFDGVRTLIVIYVGDLDPSGMYMSERDLPERLKKYEGHHIEVRRVALLPEQVVGLPSFPASDKIKDPRYRWFAANHGNTCWELDAMDPRDLRRVVEEAIKGEIEWTAWNRCETAYRAEKENMEEFFKRYHAPKSPVALLTGAIHLPDQSGGAP